MIGCEAESALEWARSHREIESHHLIQEHPWADTYRLTRGSREWFLKIVKGSSAAKLHHSKEISKAVGTRTPLVIACNAEKGWLLSEHHGGSPLDRKISTQEKVELLEQYAETQCAIYKAQKIKLSIVDADDVFQNLTDFLKSTKNSPSMDGCLKADSFLSEEEAENYRAAFLNKEKFWNEFLNQSSCLPNFVEHCDLRTANVARKQGGQLVFYDWDDAAIGPLGLSLHAQFSGCSRVYVALQSKSTNTPQTKTDRIALAQYAKPFINAGLSDRESLRAGLPASAAMGVMRYIVSFGDHVVEDSSARKTIAKNIRKRLDDLIHLSQLAEIKRPKRVFGSVSDYIELAQDPKAVPMISVTPEEHKEKNLSDLNLEAASQLFRENGTLLIENAFPVDLIDEAYEKFISDYTRYLNDEKHDDALRVGDKRFMVTLAFEEPYAKPDFFASPIIRPIMTNILGKQHILGSLTCVASLPGSKDQRMHKDHAALFREAPETELPSFAVTMIVPLIDLDEITGATRLVKGSHKVTSEQADSMPYQDPVVKRGSCFLMDFRLSHRGMANRSNKPRPIASVVYQRPWFRDYINYQKQKPLDLNGYDLSSLSSKYRHMVEWAQND